MADSIRIKRLEKVAHQRASEVVLYELADPRLQFVSITRVKLSSDLSHATVFWSVIGDDGTRSKVGHALDHAKGQIQSEIAKVFHTRRSPRITFKHDPSIEGAIRVSKLLDELKDEREEREDENAPADSAPEAAAPDEPPRTDES